MEKLNDCVSRKIKLLLSEGRPRKQAIAIAIAMCKKKGHDAIKAASKKVIFCNGKGDVVPQNIAKQKHIRYYDKDGKMIYEDVIELKQDAISRFVRGIHDASGGGIK